MKKVAKLFTLALIPFCLLWITYAQNWDDPSYDSVIWDSKCMCGTPFRELFSTLFLILIWLSIVILSLCSIPLYKKYKDTLKHPIIFRIPILNLYPLFKITIGTAPFYCLILFIWFFGYLIYSNRNWCCNFPAELVYPVIVVWLLSICILLVLLIKLIIIPRKFDKESSHKQNIN